MTDAQFIDYLFQERSEYKETPGFRLFMIGWMAAVSEEGLNAGEEAPMLHMAYTAGQHQAIARTWTDERPTEPGEYWAALHPDQRERLWASQAVMCVVIASNARWLLSVRWFDSDREECSLSLADLLFDGAKWSRRETPADPFEVTG